MQLRELSAKLPTFGWPAADAGEEKRRRLPLSEAKRSIQSGDLLLFRGAGWISRLISIAGRSDYTHAARVAWWGSELVVLEVREWRGGRIVTLDSQVLKYPGQIDVYEPNWNGCCPTYDRAGVVKYMIRLAGCSYGWLAIGRAALLHLPFIRTRVAPNLDDDAVTKDPPFCSQACVMADRVGGGFDSVPHLADEITQPGDLARTSFNRYRFTLEPDA